MDSTLSKIPRRPAEDGVPASASKKRRLDTPNPDVREASKRLMLEVVKFHHHLWDSGHFAMKPSIAPFFEVSTPQALTDFWTSHMDKHVFLARSRQDLAKLVGGDDFHRLETLPASAGGSYVGFYQLADGSEAIYVGQCGGFQKRNGEHLVEAIRNNKTPHYKEVKGYKKRLFVRTSRVPVVSIRQEVKAMYDVSDVTGKAADGARYHLKTISLNDLAGLVRELFEVLEMALYQVVKDARLAAALEGFIGLAPPTWMALNTEVEVGNFTERPKAAQIGKSVSLKALTGTCFGRTMSMLSVAYALSRTIPVTLHWGGHSFRLEFTVTTGQKAQPSLPLGFIDLLVESLPGDVAAVAAALRARTHKRLWLSARQPQPGTEGKYMVQAPADVGKLVREQVLFEIRVLRDSPPVRIPWEAYKMSGSWIQLFRFVGAELEDADAATSEAAGPSSSSSSSSPSSLSSSSVSSDYPSSSSSSMRPSSAASTMRPLPAATTSSSPASSLAPASSFSSPTTSTSSSPATLASTASSSSSLSPPSSSPPAVTSTSQFSGGNLLDQMAAGTACYGVCKRFGTQLCIKAHIHKKQYAIDVPRDLALPGKQEDTRAFLKVDSTGKVWMAMRLKADLQRQVVDAEWHHCLATEASLALAKMVLLRAGAAADSAEIKALSKNAVCKKQRRLVALLEGSLQCSTTQLRMGNFPVTPTKSRIVSRPWNLRFKPEDTDCPFEVKQNGGEWQKPWVDGKMPGLAKKAAAKVRAELAEAPHLIELAKESAASTSASSSSEYSSSPSSASSSSSPSSFSSSSSSSSSSSAAAPSS